MKTVLLSREPNKLYLDTDSPPPHLCYLALYPNKTLQLIENEEGYGWVPLGQVQRVASHNTATLEEALQCRLNTLDTVTVVACEKNELHQLIQEALRERNSPDPT